MSYEDDYGPDRCPCGRTAAVGSYYCGECQRGEQPMVEPPIKVSMTRRQIEQDLWSWQDYLAMARRLGWVRDRWIDHAEQRVAECRRLLDAKGDAA